MKFLGNTVPVVRLRKKKAQQELGTTMTSAEFSAMMIASSFLGVVILLVIWWIFLKK